MLYSMKNDFITAEIAEHGAEIKSIKFNGVDYLHNSDPKYWCYSAPLLFPNIGKLNNDETIFNGQVYPMKKHGFARLSDFKVVEHTDTCMTLLLTDNEETLKHYPYHFDMYVEYFLDKFKLRSSIKIINKSKINMPFNLGLHPAFKVPLFDNEKFEDYQVIFETPGSYETPIIDLVTGLIDWKNRGKEFINLKCLPLNYHDYDHDALVFENIKTHSIILEHKEHHHGVRVDFPDFTHLGMWTPNNDKFAPFICIEPWIGCADRPGSDGIFEHKRDVVILEPDKEFEVNYVYSFF